MCCKARPYLVEDTGVLPSDDPLHILKGISTKREFSHAGLLIALLPPPTTPESQCEHWVCSTESTLTYRSQTQSPNPCCKMEMLISNYLHKPWQNLFVGVKTPC